MAEVRENVADYLKSKLNPAQIQNIKNTWKSKKASDVTQSVKDMIKKMDIPTQLAIKDADIPHLSKLVEEKIDEGRMKDIYTMDKDGKSAEEIAKKLGVSVSSVKAILGEGYDEVTEACWTGFKQVGMKMKGGKQVPNCVPEEFVKEDQELTEFSTAQLDTLAKQYASMKDGRISIDNANKLRKIFDRIPDSALPAIRKRKIPFLSALALSRMVQKGIPVREDLEEAEKVDTKDEPAGVEIAKLRAKRDEKDKTETAKKEGELDKAKDEIAMLKTKLENEKNKAVKPEPNPETGEVPLAIGLAQKLLRDKQAKAKEQAQAQVKENNIFDMWKEAAKVDDEKEVEKDLEEYEEEIAEEVLDEMAALRKKSEKSGISYGILKKVFDRGMAAWKGGHRPGASQHQWAYARVNSFITKGSGTWGGADKDLAKQAKGQKEDLDAVPQDKDVKKKDGTQPKKYYKGLSKDTKDDRAAHFKNNKSNKEAPGDKDAKTKPSIHTKKYKKMFGEVNEKMQSGFAVRFFDPANGKRFAAAYKTRKDAQDKAAQLKKDGLKNISITTHTFNFKEADLSKSQTKKVHDKADEMPKKDFTDRYGKEKGDDVRYAVATNIIKKKLGIK